MPATDLTLDHQVIAETQATRRYFRKWERITGHLTRVAAEERADWAACRRGGGGARAEPRRRSR
jgi:hypothetical protein